MPARNVFVRFDARLATCSSGVEASQRAQICWNVGISGTSSPVRPASSIKAEDLRLAAEVRGDLGDRPTVVVRLLPDAVGVQALQEGR